MKKLETDVAVIGAGTAGLSAYRTAKAAGARVLLIEGYHYGTTCARVGCMPSKLLIAAANAAHAARATSDFGVDVDSVRVDGRAVMARVQSERDRFVGFVAGEKGLPVEDKVWGVARFLDSNRLAVGDDIEITAKSVVIATGSSPVVPPPFLGAGSRLITSDDIFELEELPRRVAVFGAGVIGLELGQALSRLGVEMRLFGLADLVGALTDPVVLEEARTIFGKELTVDFDSDVRKIHQEGDDVVIEFLDKKTQALVTERFDYLLAATGRAPNLAGLDLDKLSLELNSRGVPLFDHRTMQCGDSSIFIAGDATHTTPLLHEAADCGTIAGANAARWPDVKPGLRRSPISLLFSDPGIMMVGQRFSDLEPGTFVVGQLDFSDQGRSRVMLKNQGMIRVYADKVTQRFLGAEMIGPDAEHVAHLLAWAHQMQMTIPQMLEMPFYHPVIEEGVRTALRDAARQL